MCKGACNKKNFKFEYESPDDFTRSFWQKEPKVLPMWIAYRIILFVLSIGLEITTAFFWLEEDNPWYKNYAYVTHWSSLLQVIGFGIGAYISVVQFRKERNDPELAPTEKMPCHYKLMWALYNIVASMAFVDSVMFWLFIFQADVHQEIGFVLIDGFFFLTLIIIDICLNGMPFRFLHLYLPFTFTVVYILFTLVYQLAGGTGSKGRIPLLPVMDWRYPGSALTSSAISLALVCFSHTAYSIVYLLKIWIRKPAPVPPR